MSSPAPRRAAGPLPPKRRFGRGAALGVLSAVSALVGLGLLGLGLGFVVAQNLFFGILIAASGGLLAMVGVIGVIVAAVVMARGEPDDDGYADDDDLAMVGDFVMDDDED